MEVIWKQRLHECGILAVLTIDRVEDAIPAAEALLRGGIFGIELTLRTTSALDALRTICEKVPEMLVGAGTVITPQQVVEVAQAGADFAVSPGLNIKVLEAAEEADLPFFPGIMSPSDIETALEYGHKLLKYFPAETAGGLSHLEAMATPYKHLGISFIPLGGLNKENCGNYLSHPLISAIGGSWIAPQKLIQSKSWDIIEENAREASLIMKQARSKHAATS